jgi:hypothetical protein
LTLSSQVISTSPILKEGTILCLTVLQIMMNLSLF